jgi:hypothetical protein
MKSVHNWAVVPVRTHVSSPSARLLFRKRVVCLSYPTLGFGQHPNILSIGVQVTVDNSEQVILNHTEPEVTVLNLTGSVGMRFEISVL